MQLPAASPKLDLSRLPAPQVLEKLDFEAILTALKTEFSARYPDHSALLESDPAVKLLEVFAWRELVLRAALNDEARAVMLAHARGSDLDHLGAFFGVGRRQIEPATALTDAVLESDDELRLRIQLEPEALSQTGVTGGFYRSQALAAAPELKDVAAINRGEGRVDIVLLSRAGNGVPAPETVAAIAALFAQDDTVQLTDRVTVRPATITDYNPVIRLQVGRGPDPELVRAEAEAAVRAYAELRHRVGRTIFVQQLAAAASVGGVEHAIVLAPGGDIVPGDAGAAYLDQLTIELQVLG